MSFQLLEASVMPDGAIQLEWEDVAEKLDQQGEEMQNQIFARYSADPHSWFFQLGFYNKHKLISPSLTFWRDFTGCFIEKLRLTPDIEKCRGELVLPLDDEDLIRFQETAPLMSGGEYLRDEVFLDLWAWLHEIFAEKIAAYDGSVAEFIKQYSPDIHLVGRIYFHLVENKKSETPFAFLATYSTRLNDQGESRHLPLKYALEEYRGDQEKLLQLLVTVHEAARRSDLLANLLHSGELFHPLSWSAKEAFAFLQEILLYQETGILCRIPNWWKGKAAGIGIHISIGEKPPAMVGMGALLDFRPRLMLGDTEISEEEARHLLQQSEGLAFLKNKWVAVDSEKLQQTLAAYEKARELNTEEGISFLDAMRFSMNPQALLGPGDGDMLAGVSNGQWLQTVIAKLHRPSEIRSVKTDKSFTAKLRGYQQDGLQWLHYLHTLQFGACLADDMGLGKTVQLLAFLSTLKKEKKKTGKSFGASLLVIPASLLSNWMNEIQTFFPDLKYLAVHPDLHKPGKVPELGPDQLAELDLVITTYALTQRYTWIQEASWHYIILDEAQAIKNPGTKQTKAIKKLTAINRIAMTGTPVENRLSDLWSLFDFLNPGLLGNAKEFSTFTKGLADEPNGYAGLRKVVSPFILRRLKTDKSIISDLPDKVEVKTWAAMSKKQTVLYGEMVAGLERS